jgi:hypothetical protein
LHLCCIAERASNALDPPERPTRAPQSRPGHPERLDREEEDALGKALLCEQRGDYRKAQEWLDLLARAHKLRMAVGRGNSGKLETPGAARTGSEDGAKD